MKKNGIISLLGLLLLAVLMFTGCSATVQGAVNDPADRVAESGAADTAASDVADSGMLIGEDQAKVIALEHAGLKEADVKGLRVEYEIDDGVKQYDVEFHRGEMEYEYEINAQTGAVISYDKDRDD